MPENQTIYTNTTEAENDFLVRVFFDGPGSLDGMGSGSLVFDEGLDNIYGTADDELFVLTAGHVAGNDLDGLESGWIDMYINDQWITVETFSEEDVFLKSHLSNLPEDDIALIDVDESIFPTFNINPENLPEIPSAPLSGITEIDIYGASMSRNEPRKAHVSDYALNRKSIVIDEDSGIPGDSGGPVVATLEDGSKYIVGLASQNNAVIRDFFDLDLTPLTLYTNFDQDDINFIKDVFKYGEYAKHIEIDELDITTAEGSKMFYNVILPSLTAGLIGTGILAVYGFGSMWEDIVNHFRSKNIEKTKKQVVKTPEWNLAGI